MCSPWEYPFPRRKSTSALRACRVSVKFSVGSPSLGSRNNGKYRAWIDGVETLDLGTDRIDDIGPNAGFYERAAAPEIRSYFREVLDSRLLGSGRVRFFGRSKYVFDSGNGHKFYSLDSGDHTDVTIRRRLVDATYLETSVPATHTPTFTVNAGVRFVPVTPGVIGGLDIEVTGVAAGTPIVVGPFQVLRDLNEGARVRVAAKGR